MSGLSAQEVERLRSTLEDAVVKCSERCLYQSAKWAAELLNSLPSPEDFNLGSETDADSPMENAEPILPSPIVISPNADPEEARLEAQELPKYLLAKSYFDCREYDRCAAVFLPHNYFQPHNATSSTAAKFRVPPVSKKGKESVTPSKAVPKNELPKLSQKTLFLALYAKYMAGEKRKDEDSEMIMGPADGGVTINRELVGIQRSLEGWFASRQSITDKGSDQGWLEYLYGIALSKGKVEQEAKRWLLKSVHLYQYNWGAWQELSNLIGSVDELNTLKPQLPQNLITLIFCLFTSQELYQATQDAHDQLNGLETVFPHSQFLKVQRALLLYHSKDFEEAEDIFFKLSHQDPYRLDSLDAYSNVLFVLGNRPKLAFIAQIATATDKFRPETCCVVGNYYAIKSEHEKAVMYFRRALTLDRSFLDAWTLMGHEYVEMKNTHAAIESYRRAVDTNRKDYRAWYGLGQAYEMLEMHFYGLYYYQRAASLKPLDPKMWQAVGGCYARMGRVQHGIKALKRALIAGTYYETGTTSSFGSRESDQQLASHGYMDPEILHEIARLYERLDGGKEQAAEYMELCLAQETGPNADDDEGGGGGLGVTQTTSRARHWLAKWYYEREDLERAHQLATELCQDGVDVEDAKALIRDIRARQERIREEDNPNNSSLYELNE
ncbi:MAG: Anaphase-promoting complex subunit 23 [Cirrosporium novae-zelandiae]|nr:MAG: Anaphase-promoting complex subunit 23 [Cirrosporium novae-zelandiae]